MKKVISCYIMFALCEISINLDAQNYKTSIGITSDFGDGWTFVGPSFKNYFTKKSAVNIEGLFHQNVTFLATYYHYNGTISKEYGSTYYIGAGPAVSLANGKSVFWIRPAVGLEFNIKPFALNIEWRPVFSTKDLRDNLLERFGAGLKYCF